MYYALMEGRCFCPYLSAFSSVPLGEPGYRQTPGAEAN